MKILVVDDSGLSRKMLIKRIPSQVKESATIIQGTNGEEGVTLYKEHQPDLVFMDLTMPIMDGFEALEAIMAHNKEAFVVVVSADIQAKAKERVLGMGAKFMEHKPITQERIDSILNLF